MVEEIEKLGAILQPPMFSDWDGLQRREINVEGARSDQDVPPRIAEGPYRRGSKRAGCEPLGDALPARAGSVTRLREHVGTVAADSGSGTIFAREESQRKAALPVPDCIGLPAAEQTAGPNSLLRRWQLPNIIHSQPVRNVVVGDPAIGFRI